MSEAPACCGHPMDENLGGWTCMKCGHHVRPYPDDPETEPDPYAVSPDPYGISPDLSLELDEARARISELEVERDRLSLLEANFESYKEQWKRHYETEADKRIPETNEAIHRLAAAFGLDEYTAQSAVDGVIQLWGDARARIAALEAERAKLEHERDQWRSAHNGLAAQVAALAGEEKP